MADIEVEDGNVMENIRMDLLDMDVDINNIASTFK